MPIYFAYGSNLLTKRLQLRCPGAQPLGRASLSGWRVDFAKYSWMDGSGKASILPAADSATEGVLYDLPEGDLAQLDKIEGVGNGYDRIEVSLVAGDHDVVAVTYIATDPRTGQRPFDWYLGLIIAGCLENELGKRTTRSYKIQPWDADPEPDRPSYVEASAVLSDLHGPNWRDVLFA